MNINTQLKKAYRLNLLTFALIAFSVIWMFSGIHFGNAPKLLEGSRFGILKFYTTDSNILMGIIALITALEQRKILKEKKAAIPGWIPVIKLVGVVGVTLTMLVTV